MIPEFRHEDKFCLSMAEYNLIRQKIKRLLPKDTHARAGYYWVRSLYFENYRFGSFNDKLDGIGERYKYRLRMYDNDSNSIKFEVKIKKGEYVRKKVLKVDEREARAIIDNDFSILLKRKMETEYADIILNQFKALMIVDYKREPFIYKPCGLRITFDSDLSAGQYPDKFFHNKAAEMPLAVESPVIMELKYSDWLPGWLTDLIRSDIGTRRSISKYCLGFPNPAVFR